MKSTNEQRRQFLKGAATAAAAFSIGQPFIHAATAKIRKGPNDKLNIGLVGAAGRAHNTIRDFCKLDETVVALCDVDPKRLETGVALATERFPQARRYLDYRKMFDAERELDAIVVTTPDHMHAPISMLAMSRGLHVFCEKPLTRTVWEARRMSEMAKQSGVVTQMGTQGSASHDLRRAVEIIQAGVIGKVREVHVWTDRTSRLPNNKSPTEMPEGMDWDVWLGVAAEEPFSKRYHPANWRWWPNYGAGALGDMGCHLTNLPFRALDLRVPSEIDVEVSDAPAKGMFPSSCKVTYSFAELNGGAPLTMTWYDGGRLPDERLLREYGIGDGEKVSPSEKLIIGERGVIYGDRRIKLNGESKFTPFDKHEACKAVAETLPRYRLEGTLGQYSEWVDACKGVGSTFTSFDVGAAQTEMVLLGTLAIRLGRKIGWDAKVMRVPDAPEADALLRPTYRSGFTVG
jgi:predicted dehydrogenase